MTPGQHGKEWQACEASRFLQELPAGEIILKTAVERCQPFDTPAVRATQGERPLTKLVTAPFVLSALRSKAYRSMSGVATTVFRIIYSGVQAAGSAPVVSKDEGTAKLARLKAMLG